MLDAGGTLRPLGFGAIASFASPASATPETAIADPVTHVGEVATTTIYDVDRWLAKGEPPIVVTLAREVLRDDGEGGGTAIPTAAQVTVAVAHYDGFGRALQTKLKVGPGPAVARNAAGALVLGADGRPTLAEVASRWQVSGHVVYNRKQQPVRQHEPFFSTNWRYEPEPQLAAFGVARITLHDAQGRVVRQDAPNGTFSRVEHGAWGGRMFDANDTVEDSAYRLIRAALAATHPERKALEGARAHARTPITNHVDPLGRTVLIEEEDGEGNARRYRTLYAPDGAEAALINPRGVTATSYLRDMLGRPIRTRSADAGERLAFHDGFDRPVQGWDPLGAHVTRSFDTLDRPLTLHVDGLPGLDRRAEQVVYGEDSSVANAADRNLRGQAALVRDDAGVRTIERCSIDGQPIETRLRLISDIQAKPDWRTPVSVTLMPETFTTRVTFDGIGRPVREALPDGTTLSRRYDPDGGVKQVAVTSDDGLVSNLEIVADARHNARGQRERLLLGNGVEIVHSFDPDTWRTRNIRASRAGATPAMLQDIDYVYDPVGNIVASVDKVHQPGAATPVITGLGTPAEREFTYNAFYQLRRATGRVHKALLPNDHRTDAPNAGSIKGTRRLSLNDGAQLQRYTQTYTYDIAGNMTKLRHVGTAASWTTDFWVAAASNRSLPTLDSNGVAVATPEAAFDAAGNLLRFPHLRDLTWGYRQTLDKALIVDRSAAGDPNDAEYYAYDASRRRVRKRTERLNGAGVVEATDILYLDGCEIKRITRAATLLLERRTAHVSDGAQRIALIHRWTVDTGGRETTNTTKARVRYQLGDHLGSAQLQLDETGAVIACEEYLPFGGTAFIGGDDLREVETNAYRFCGKERDDATGLYYFGQRYYACWLNRWISTDPAGDVDGLNRYLYVRNNPISYFDPDGLQTSAKPGKMTTVYGPQPLDVYAALSEHPDRERLKKLAAQHKLYFYWDRIRKAKPVFGTLEEIENLAKKDVAAGVKVERRLPVPPNAKPGDSMGKGKGKKKTPPKPANDNASASDKTGGDATIDEKGKSSDPGQGQDGTGGSAKAPGGGPGEGKGTGKGDDPGGNTSDPGDGSKPGDNPGNGGGDGTRGVGIPGTGGDGPGLGKQGTGKGGGGASDVPGTGGVGTTPGAGSGIGAGNSAGSDNSDQGVGESGTGHGGVGDSGSNAAKGEGGGAVGGGSGLEPGGRPGGLPGGSEGGVPGGKPGAPASDKPGGKDGDPDGIPGVEGKTNENGKPGAKDEQGKGPASGKSTTPGGNGKGEGKSTEDLLYDNLEQSNYSADALNELNDYYYKQFNWRQGNLQEILSKRATAFLTAASGQYRRENYLAAARNGSVGLLDVAGTLITGNTWEETSQETVKGILIGSFLKWLGAVSKAAGGAAAGGVISKAAGGKTRLQHAIRGTTGERGVGVFYVEDLSKLTPKEIESITAAVRDADFQAGMRGGLVRRAGSGRAVEDMIARQASRALGLDSSEAAGHIPDAAAGGSPLGPIMGIPKSVNSSWGGQLGRYQPGFAFEGFSLFDKASRSWIYISLSLENAPPAIGHW